MMSLSYTCMQLVTPAMAGVKRGVWEDVYMKSVLYNLQRKINPIQHHISRFLSDSFSFSPLHHDPCTYDQLQGFLAFHSISPSLKEMKKIAKL